MDRSQPLDLINMELDNRKLHLHQIKATEGLNNYFDLKSDNNKPQEGLLVMPTGSGKTFTAVNWLLDKAVANGYKVIWFVHRQELIDQADYTFRQQAPLLLSRGKNKLRVLPISRAHYSMSNASRQDVYVCSIASAASKNGSRYIERMLGQVGKEKLIVVIDEAHHAVSPSYQKVIRKITNINPSRILLGLTATPTRMQKSEKKKLLKMFKVNNNGYIHEVKLKDLLANGFLAQPFYKRIETEINGEIEFETTDEDKEYFEKHKDLSERIKDQLAKSSARNEMIVDEYIKNKNKYGKTLVFAINRLHAKTLTETFKSRGIQCDYCISQEPGAREKIEDFKNNKLDVLVNVQILTEGSDVPDIQSIFLTRNTNSDALLMQMVGRGLRGKDAGGTKDVYIVDFHDTWDRFSFWLDPKELLKEKFGEFIEDESSAKKDKEDIDELDGKPKRKISNLWEIYMKIYSSMKSNIIGIEQKEVFPHGWYSVVDEEGEDTKVLVFDNQLDGYKSICEDIEKILDEKLTAQQIVKYCFDCETNIPKVSEISLILDHIQDTNEMPEYFTFIQRNEVDSEIIAKELIEKNLRRLEENEYLKERYDKTPIIRDLYKSFELFKNTIKKAAEDIEGGKTTTNIISIDERKEFNIVEGYHDLNELLKEVICEVEANGWFKVDKIPEIRWSNKPLRSRFGLCTRHEDGSYSISINKLLCSPEVEPETVEYLIYHELLHACGYWNHNDEFREQEWKYADSDEHDGFLDELFIRYKIDEIIPPRKRKYKPGYNA